MRHKRVLCAVQTILVMIALVTPGAIFAEPQDVQVGGSIRIRGNYYTGPSQADSLTVRNPGFQPFFTNSFQGVPGGNPLAGYRWLTIPRATGPWLAAPGRHAVTSLFSWNRDGSNDNSFVEQRTTLGVRADLVDNVSAFVEFDAYSLWGDSFRSNYITGVDRVGTPDVSLYQSYIEAKDVFGAPLCLRIGRQEILLGNGWLVSPNDTSSLFYGTSFYGIRATYATDRFSVDAFLTKLAERSPVEQDGDIDFAGIYASYLGIKDLVFDSYWFLVRDAQGRRDTNLPWFNERVEDFLSVDDYDVTNLNTLGLRAAGKRGKFDIESEVAYQFGNADAVGATFAGAGLSSPYGPKDARWDTWGANIEAGYTFDGFWTPRVFIGGAYLGGEDHRGINAIDWLRAVAGPLWHAKPSVSFNRLFSHAEYSEFIENTDLSNAWIVRTGVSANPTESLKLTFLVSYFEALDPYAAPWPTFTVLGARVAPLVDLSFVTKDNSKNLGTEIEIIAAYKYSEDLSFEAGWAHLFTGKGLEQGSFSNGNGLLFNGGTARNDADYLYLETRLRF